MKKDGIRSARFGKMSRIYEKSESLIRSDLTNLVHTLYEDPGKQFGGIRLVRSLGICKTIALHGLYEYRYRHIHCVRSENVGFPVERTTKQYNNFLVSFLRFAPVALQKFVILSPLI